MAKVGKKYPEVDKIKKDAQSLKENTVELGRHIKAEGSEKAEELKEVTAEKISHLSDQSKEQLLVAEMKIREKPLQSIAIAFVAGAAISMLFGRR